MTLAESDRSSRRLWLRRSLREWIALGVMALLLLATRSTLADHYVVPTGSMEFTLLPGDRVVVDKRAYGWRLPFTGVVLMRGDAPRPGEIAVFDAPDDQTRLIKRIVARGGDQVQLRRGRLTVNGRSLAVAGAEPLEQIGERRVRLNLAYGGGPDFGPTRIPAGKLLVVGDARGNSRDGRSFGLVDADTLYGRAIAIYYRRRDGLTWRALR